MRKNIYLALCEQLQDTFEHIDLWNRNIEFTEQEQAWNTPAVFIEFLPITWQGLGQGCQQAELTIRFHIVTRCTASSANGSAYQADAIAYLDLLDTTHRLLHRFSGEKFNGLMRTRSETNHEHTEIVESIEEYKCLVFDDAAKPETEIIPKETSIDIETQDTLT
jgi:hypothetical protein